MHCLKNKNVVYALLIPYLYVYVFCFLGGSGVCGGGVICSATNNYYLSFCHQLIMFYIKSCVLYIFVCFCFLLRPVNDAPDPHRGSLIVAHGGCCVTCAKRTMCASAAAAQHPRARRALPNHLQGPWDLGPNPRVSWNQLLFHSRSFKAECHGMSEAYLHKILNAHAATPPNYGSEYWQRKQRCIY